MTTYWVAVCTEADGPFVAGPLTGGAVLPGGPGRGSVNCPYGPDGTISSSMTVIPINSDPFGGLSQMSVSDALLVSGMVGALWAGAWGFRQLCRVLGAGDTASEE